MTHSWNGKFRRPADLWTPNYETPMRGSLLWVYEGLTQYYGVVLAARSGLWSHGADARRVGADGRDVSASRRAASGAPWPTRRTIPILSARRPAPWRSWLRNEDYYSEGLLVWLDADTLIRERTNGRRSLDDFARAFFGINDGSWVPGDLHVRRRRRGAERPCYAHDWATFLRERIYDAGTEPPLDGLARGGYRLVFKEERSAFQREAEAYGAQRGFQLFAGARLRRERQRHGRAMGRPGVQSRRDGRHAGRRGERRRVRQRDAAARRHGGQERDGRRSSCC